MAIEINSYAKSMCLKFKEDPVIVLRRSRSTCSSVSAVGLRRYFLLPFNTSLSFYTAAVSMFNAVPFILAQWVQSVPGLHHLNHHPQKLASDIRYPLSNIKLIYYERGRIITFIRCMFTGDHYLTSVSIYKVLYMHEYWQSTNVHTPQMWP